MARIGSCLIAAVLATATQAQSIASEPEGLVYGDVRVAWEANDLPGESNGLKNYASRVGFRYLHPVETSLERTRLVFQTELGFSEDKLGLRGTRLLFAGIRSPIGQLTFGKQWSAFYTTVGAFMDAGFVQSGFGYLGSDRVSESLQYSHLFGQTYLQFDAIADDEKGGGGANRLQGGASFEDVHWRAGLAFDVSRKRERAGSVLNGSFVGEDALCDRRGVDCFGAMIGWAADGLSIDLGAVRSRARSEHATGTSLTIGWKPNQFSYYVELSAVNQPDERTRTAAFGARYQWGPYASAFVEASRSDKRVRDTIEHVLGVGLRLEFEAYPFAR